MTNYRFKDGAAIVFGGSGGLGTGIVDLLSKCGTNVAFTYLNNEEAAKENIAKIEKNGQKGYSSSVDLLDINKVENFVKSSQKEFGRIHSIIFATRPFLHIMPILDADQKGCL
jgi:Dehydrogenases with different specificities (related to short-chain alcohol dehydrogenases)